MLPSALGPFGPVACDGTDVWVGSVDRVFRIRASDGKLLEEWPIRKPAGALLVAMGRVFVAGFGLPGEPGILSMIDPRRPPGDAAVVVTDLPSYPFLPAFDGERIWTANSAGSVSTISPAMASPWPVDAVWDGFQVPSGIVFDGHHVWVSDAGNCTIVRLDTSGAVRQTVSVGHRSGASLPMTFDGSQILVANPMEGLRVVRATDGASVAQVDVAFGAPCAAAFDGERILVLGQGDPSRRVSASLSLLRASDYSVLGVHALPDLYPLAAASDGLDFWITVETEQGSAVVRL
jgi:DNA-binding beta-propeller fold protein YncE